MTLKNLYMEKDKLNRTQYVLGFAFSSDKKDIVLIEKQKPAWQAGKYNGVGGKVEPNESWLEAMCREFEEETGVFIDQWEEFAIMESGDWICYCYRAFTYGIDKCKTMETEKVERLALDTALLCRPLMENLKWLIHLALDETPRFSKIVY